MKSLDSQIPRFPGFHFIRPTKSAKSGYSQSHYFFTLQILNAKVIFIARRTVRFINDAGFIIFDQIDIDTGHGFPEFRPSSYKIPVDGIYKMTFSARVTKFTSFRLFKNKFFEMHIMDGLDKPKDQDEFADWYINSFTWMIRCKKGDKLKLKPNGPLYANSEYPMLFTGELLHID